MTEKKLTDEELKQVTGGADVPDGRKPKYQEGDVVEYQNGWILEIVQVIHWASDDVVYLYKTIIRESNHTTGRFVPGRDFNAYESLILHKKYGI